MHALRYLLPPLLLLVLGAPAARGGDAPDPVPAWLAAFSKAWPAERVGWRTAEDASWKAYGRALQQLVAHGKAAPVIAGMADENRQVRALCARTLGYIGDPAAVPTLAAALTEDDWPTVRLLAADSLGAIHSEAAVAALEAAVKDATGDVAKHVKIQLRRTASAVAELGAAAKALDPGAFDQAVTGKLAPALSLEAPDGTRVRLADFRGKRPVLLVFLYGDG